MDSNSGLDAPMLTGPARRVRNRYNISLDTENRHDPARRTQYATTRDSVGDIVRTLKFTRVPVVPKDYLVDTRPLSDMCTATHLGVWTKFSSEIVGSPPYRIWVQNYEI